ncbi:hypothetical protein [Roseimicrobium sp. ORNL1]|uniref:hypothetical protein n=1 Tax=Roseimicrobium sp. ORNL1 TaxID=2711231 RepID=UPI0013E12503|nr:hypothetical protein [Roseimicrobium sp. ORNL1]QIF02422.1 hypothetical protein G5S37_13105 [Roseimicrobium sp. ORNL1]
MKLPVICLCFSFAVFAWSQDPSAKPKQPADPGFEIKGMRCFSDSIINKAEVGKSGFKVEIGGSIGTRSGPGSELSDFTFPENQQKQYFIFDFGPQGAEKMITAKLKAMRTTAGAGLSIVEVSGKTDKEGKLPAEWNLKKNWPVGFFKVFFTCEGQPVGTAGYLVKATKDREAPIKATGVTILSFKDGKSTEKTGLTTSDNDLVFKCATTGGNTKGVPVRMFIGQIDDKGEKSILKNSEITVEDWPLEDTELVYSFELPDKFPAGKYHMVIYANNEMLIAHPFTVAEE